jgi:lipopolysaccharide/colanic/teichoic acid biosynthesis glycosyltransferase
MLCLGGMFICFVETYKNRKTRIFQKYNSPWSGVVYTWDTLRYRVIPKIPFTEKIFHKVTGGKGRLMSGVEALGRLYAAGFELIEEKEIGGYLYFAARKVQKPMKVTNATYWPIVKLKRVGIAGKEFNVYKLRTMYPYSEFLQDMLYKKNKLTDGGKFKDDFRVSRFGKLLRKIWLDEVPMIWNLLRGDIKLVGVRPLSKQYFNLYHAELKQKRTQFKPGLIPPYFADMPSTLEEIMESEMRYLNAYSNSPIATDFQYFFKILKNILFKGARSK